MVSVYAINWISFYEILLGIPNEKNLRLRILFLYYELSGYNLWYNPVKPYDEINYLIQMAPTII